VVNNISNTVLQTVDPVASYYKVLDNSRLDEYNFRINNKGKTTIKRFQHDNKQVLLTHTGFHRFRNIKDDTEAIVKILKKNWKEYLMRKDMNLRL
jgi:arginine deiminase